MEEFLRYAKKRVIIAAVIAVVASVVMLCIGKSTHAQGIIFGGVAGLAVLWSRVRDIQKIADNEQLNSSKKLIAGMIKSQIRTIVFRLMPIILLFVININAVQKELLFVYILTIIASYMPDFLLYIDKIFMIKQNKSSSASEGNRDA